MKIVHLGDLHFGYGHYNYRRANNQNIREHDFEQAAMLAADYVLSQQPDLVIISGDLLQSTRVTSTGLNAAITFCKQLVESGAPVVVVPGNHDEPEAEGRFSDLTTCANHSGIILVNTQTHLDIAGVRLHLVPFRAVSRAYSGKTQLMPFEFSEQTPNVLVSHGYVNAPGLPSDPEGEEIQLPEGWIEDSRFELVCLGHIHQHMRINDHAFYCGALERRNFGERNQECGFWIHTLQDGKLSDSQSVLVKDLGEGLYPRPMQQLEIDATDLTAGQLERQVSEILATTDLGRKMIKIVMTNVSSTIDRARLRARWRHIFFDAGGFALEDSLQTRQIGELFQVDIQALPPNIGQAVSVFIEEQEFTDADYKQEILELASTVMHQAHERLIAEDA